MANLLKKWRRERNMTYAQMGILLKVTPSIVCKWEKRECTPTPKNACRIAKQTKIPVSHWGYVILANGKIARSK